MPDRTRVIRREIIYRGRILKLERVRVVEPGGIHATREIVIHPGSVVVIPRLADGRLVLIRQYRFAVGSSLWELVAGAIEPGESAEEAARRELLEETGYQSRRVRRVQTFFPSPGFLTEKMVLVEARDLKMTKARPEADERIRVERFTPSRLRRLIQKNLIRDEKSS